ncbi:D-alanyl-D-alanine carboxypeptidase family protein [Profundibacter amoris]|uniref:serine-type D-Ala-D-Ala carboxypeptidase n=1 Tax=Profundibacter amoris TaxID=2171755 RepID=A0A347UIJ4_9RHOB|nr:D-alanyl-D-alanine carboxypeptidase family protein [Profundibacter amoris]AXX98672.1 D-alanyl-D-alanine carboxypeptidase [Profundibacter amoris]
MNLRALPLIAILVTLMAALPSQAQFDTRATAAYVIDHTTDTVLLSKQADLPLPPASMSKLMTLNMVFEALQDGRLRLDDKLPVSQAAMDYKGSTMFLNTSDRVRVEDLLRGVIVLSGNDAAAVLAEALSPDGTEAGFARMMTERAKELGMTNSHFTNSNGWPQAGHRMSVHDLAILANRIITEFPTFYPLFAETEFLFDGRAPQNKNNRNPLLKLNIGADGLKTGHTVEAGYGLVGSAKQGDRRIIFVITGLPSEQARAEEAQRIVNWAFRQFVEKKVANEGKMIAQADVWMGDETRVGLVAPKDLLLLVPALSKDALEANVSYQSPIEAPIEKGQKLAELVIKRKGLPDARLPLVADRDIPRGGFFPRLRTASKILLNKAIGRAQDLL